MDLSWWYFLIKLAAYSGWVGLGLSWFSSSKDSIPVRALLLGTLRLLMGLGFGIVIWLGGSMVFAGVGEVFHGDSEMIASAITYLSVYIPVRWIEWSIFDAIMSPQSRTLRGFLLGPASRHRLWRLGGITVSCLADIPVIVSLGGILPVGRFMC